MNELTRWLRRTLDVLDVIGAELEKLRLLKERELDVRIAYEGREPYIVPVKPVEE